MTTKQVADIIRMLLGYLKGEIEPPKQETIEEAKAFEQQGYECLEMAIKSLEALQTISNLFSKWQNGEVDDNEYFFQMQNILLFGKTLDGR